MASSDSGSESDGMVHKAFDVADCQSKVICCCMYSRTLTLEDEEAVLTTSTCISQQSKRMPYGELGSVQHTTACGCCHSFTSNLNPSGDNGQKMPISPGFGCDADLVEEVVRELKARMKGRGDTGNIQKAEEALKLMKQLNAKVDALMAAMQVEPGQVKMEEVHVEKFEHLDFDVTDQCFKCCTCCMGSKLLNLDPEEANLKVTTCCSTSTQKRPYGELGEVSQSKECGCCHGVSSGLGPMSPGWGCEEDKVQEIVKELKRRMKARGDTGNIQRQEEINAMVRHQDAKLNALLGKMGVPVPAAPSQAVMG